MKPATFSRRQSGLTMWGWLSVVLVIVVVALTALRLAPHYVDYNVIVGILDRLPPEQVHSKMTRGEIRELFQKQFRIENFSMPVADVVNIDRTRDQTIVTIDYEVREHLAYNADIVLSFDAQRTYQ